MRFLHLVAILSSAAIILCACGKENPQNHDTAESQMEMTETSPADTEPLPDVSDAWNKSDYPALVAHAGGSIYGYRLTNSLEAINNAYSNGFRLIELDFQITSDEKYVLLHDWESMAYRMLFEEGQLTHDEFLASPAFADLTLLDLDKLVLWLDDHPDCRIITDAKCENLPFLTHLSTLESKDRFIPQAYSYEEYKAARELGFDDVILTLYAMNSPVREITSFICDQKPFAVTIPETVLSEELLTQVSDVGVVVYTHTVNDLSTFEKWRELGLHGIYTDHFIPNKWVY